MGEWTDIGDFNIPVWGEPMGDGEAKEISNTKLLDDIEICYSPILYILHYQTIFPALIYNVGLYYVHELRGTFIVYHVM